MDEGSLEVQTLESLLGQQGQNLAFPHVLITTYTHTHTDIHLSTYKHESEFLKVPYYTVFHYFIIGLRYIQNMSLKCLALKYQTDHAL